MTFDKTLAGFNPGQFKTKEENGLLMLFCLTVSEKWYICVQKRPHLLKDQAPKSVPTNGCVASTSNSYPLRPRHRVTWIKTIKDGLWRSDAPVFISRTDLAWASRIITLRVITIPGVVLSVIKFVFGYWFCVYIDKNPTSIHLVAKTRRHGL